MRTLVLTSTLFSLTGCLVGDVSILGKHCSDDLDCPAGYACAVQSGAPGACVPEDLVTSVGEEGDGGTSTGSGDGGEPPLKPVDPNNSTGPFYCTDVKPLLDLHCASCHTSPSAGGAPSSFRLDYYAPEDASGLPGAYAKALRIVARVTAPSGQMPPSGPLSAADQATLAAWVEAGAPECADVAPPDGGIPMKEVPEVVSFSQHVQPILNDFCVSCHSGSVPPADLDLSEGRAWAEMLGSGQGKDSDECGSGAVIVSPGDPGNSVLWEVLAGQSGCAPTMPYQTDGLKTTSPIDFEIIEKWIVQGALDN